MRDVAEYAMFSRGEMDHRYARARDGMARAGLDALLVSGEENFQYFTGTSASLALHYSLSRPNVLILPLRGEPIVLSQTKEFMTLSSYITEFREYFDVLHFPPTLIAETLEDVGLEHHRVGVELGQEQRMGIPVGRVSRPDGGDAGHEFVDAADLFVGLRMVKSEEELAYMRRAAEVTGRARQRLFDRHVRPGMTERDVARTMRRLILEEGGDRTSFVHLQLDAPGCKNQFHYDRPLRRGDVLAVDTGAYVGMYTIDYPRMATLGTRNRLPEARARGCAGSVRRMAEALRPGLRCSDLHRLALGRSPTWAASSTGRTRSPAAGSDTARACCSQSRRVSTHATTPAGAGHGAEHRARLPPGGCADALGGYPCRHRDRARAADAGDLGAPRDSVLSSYSTCCCGESSSMVS